MAESRAETFDHVKIAVREKPLSDADRGKVQVVLRSDQDKLVAFYPESTEGLVYNYDYFYPEEATQIDLFQTIGAEMVEFVMAGYSSTCVACGPSNAGKTHALFGSAQEPGLIQMTTKELFHRIATQETHDINVRMAYWDVSCDGIFDALGPNEGKTFSLHKSEQFGATLVAGLTVVDLNTWDDLDQRLYEGSEARVEMANKRGVKWHGFVRLFLEMIPRATNDSKTSCMMTFVQMKGADRVGQHGARGAVLRQGSNINKSVSLLGSAMLHAVDFRRSAVKAGKLSADEIAAKSQSFFMESKFTQLLSHALCGNEATYMLASVSTLDYHETTDTLETLQNAQQLTTRLKTRTVTTDHGKLQKQLQKVQANMTSSKLAEGHPLNEIEERVRALQMQLLGEIPPEEDRPAKKAALPSQSVPEGVQKWKQSVVLGKMHGDRATVYIPADAAGKKHTYKGQWAKGKREGFGEHVTETIRYEGSWKDGMRDGEGTLWTRPNPAGEWVRVYKGEWGQDKRHGHGTQWSPNGDVYTGMFKYGKRWGFGKLFLVGGDRIEGQFKDDHVEGVATLYRQNGDRFDGCWHRGLREGPGIWFYETKQQLFRGEWHKGTPKFGVMEDLESKSTNQTSRYLPRVGLADPEGVLAKQKAVLDDVRAREGMYLEQYDDADADDGYGDDGEAYADDGGEDGYDEDNVDW